MGEVIDFPTKTVEEDDGPYALLHDGEVVHVVSMELIRQMALGLIDRGSVEDYDAIMECIAYDWLREIGYIEED